MEEIYGFTVAPGTGVALSNMNDNRAYYTFDGDLNQMGIIETTLRQQGFPVVKTDVYPGFVKEDEDQYKKALVYLFKHRIEGWWSQKLNLLRYGICTKEEFDKALRGG